MITSRTETESPQESKVENSRACSRRYRQASAWWLSLSSLDSLPSACLWRFTSRWDMLRRRAHQHRAFDNEDDVPPRDLFVRGKHNFYTPCPPKARHKVWLGDINTLAGNVAILDVVRSWFWRHVFVSSRHVGPTRPTCRRHHVMPGTFFCVLWEERKFPSSPATAKITKVGIQLHFGWAHAHPGNCLSNLKILARYIIPFLTGLFLLRETTL